MLEMFALNATEVRKDWSSVIDIVTREKPLFIKRTRDMMMLTQVDFVKTLLKSMKIAIDSFTEEDGTITLSTKDLDIAAHGNTIEEAKLALARNIYEYAEEFYREFKVWSSAPNRKDHVPFIMKALLCDNIQELEAEFVCLPGKN